MIAAPTEHLSNALPDDLVAVRTHRWIMATREVQSANSRKALAERAARADGLSPKAMREAMLLLDGGPEKYEQHQRDLLTILTAMRCAVQAELPAAVETTTDESPEDRRAGIYREGFAASIRGAPRSPHYHTAPDDAAAWLEGFDSFLRVLAAFELTENQKRGGK